MGKRAAVKLTEFDRFCESALALGVLEPAAVEALRGELSRREATRSELMQRHASDWWG